MSAIFVCRLTLNWSPYHITVMTKLLRYAGSLNFLYVNGKLPGDPSTKRKRSTYCWPWKQLLITLWYLGNPECIRSVSDRFDVTCSIVLRITTRMCEAVVNITPHFNQWPTGEGLQQVVEGFNQHNGLLRCIGAVDGTHIPIKAPRQHC